MGEKGTDAPHSFYINEFCKRLKENKNEYEFLKDDISKLILHLSKIREKITPENSNDIIKKAKKIWKILFRACLTSLFHELNGLEDLYSYLDQFVEYEELLYGSDEKYRDHFLHSLWVYFIGDHFLSKVNKLVIGEVHYKHFLAETDELANNKKDFEFEEDLKIGGEVHNHLISRKREVWCFIALTHDLGYPLEKIRKIRGEINKILKYLDFQEIPPYRPVIMFTHERIFEYILKIINLRIAKCANKSKSSRDYYKFYIRNDWSVLMAKNLLQYEHGMISCYILMKNLKAFYKKSLLSKELNYTVKWAKDIIVLREIIQAINFHSDKFTNISHLFSFSSYLFFIDLFEDISRWTRKKELRNLEMNTCEIKYLDLASTEEEAEFVIKLKYKNLEDYDFFKEIFASKLEEFVRKFDFGRLSKRVKKIKLQCSMKIKEFPKNCYKFCLEKINGNVEFSISFTECYSLNQNQNLNEKLFEIKIKLAEKLKKLEEIFENEFKTSIKVTFKLKIGNDDCLIKSKYYIDKNHDEVEIRTKNPNESYYFRDFMEKYGNFKVISHESFKKKPQKSIWNHITALQQFY
ncbi:MAG: hypothetical protein ACTSRG_21730 [Candidatus Helarchaeota archaeon]